MGNNYDFCSSVRFSLSWNSLKYKYENKMNREEFYLYQTLVDEVSCLALDLKLDYKLCEALAYVHSFAFCDYGNAGWEVIRKYLEDNNINIDIRQIKLEIVKRKIKSVNSHPRDDFYNYVDEMFSNNIITKEVKLVNECHKIIKSLQPLKNYDLKRYFQLEGETIKELKERSFENNDICTIDLSKYIPNDMPMLDIHLDDETYTTLYKAIEDNVKYFDEKYPQKSKYENLISAISYYVDE
jgi:hypothetical protein